MIFELLLIFGAASLTVPVSSSSSEVDENQKKIAYLDGDFVIGALFSVHEEPKSKSAETITCGPVREQYGIQRVEAALWTVDQINKKKDFLKNFTLGIEIRDTCWYARLALRQALEFIDLCPQNPSNVNSTQLRKRTVIGVIGPPSSEETVEVQNLLQIFHVPQIGYSATTTALSDRSKYGYFFRVVPPDHYQASVMVSILLKFNWTYVNALHSEGKYGNDGMKEFEKLIESRGNPICIADRGILGNSTTEHPYEEILIKFKGGKARVIVCFCQGEEIKELLKTMKKLNITGYFVIVSSDGWGGRNDVVKEEFKKEAQGHITIRPQTYGMVPGFRDYYSSLFKSKNNLMNPWFNEFCESQRSSTGSEQSSEYTEDPKLSFVVKAIYAFAHALRNFIDTECVNDTSSCINRIYSENNTFLKYVANVSFVYENENVTFDKNGDPIARYDILNYQEVNGSYDYYTVGSWNQVTSLNITKIQLPNNSTHITSVCASPCEPGTKMVLESEHKCCWRCENCLPREISDGRISCQECNKTWYPNAAKTECVKMEELYIRWDSVEAIICVLVSVIGILLTLLSVTVYYRFRETPLVKLSSTELCYVMFGGMIFLYSCTFILLAKPTKFSCTMVRLIPGVSLTAMFGALLLKTSRIARILTCSKKRFPKLKHKYISSDFQLFACSVFILVEVGICTLHLITDPVKIEKVPISNKLMLRCSRPENELTVPHILNVILLTYCTWYAFKTRNLPDYFNEAKFIAFSCYSTAVSWASFIFIYLNNDSKIIPMCLTLDLGAFINLSCLFFPKLYIILWRPDKNDKRFVVTTDGLRRHFGSVESVRNSTISTNNITPEVRRNNQLPMICLLESSSG